MLLVFVYRNCLVLCADGWMFGGDISVSVGNIQSKQSVTCLRLNLCSYDHAEFAFVEPGSSYILGSCDRAS